jgi:predicted dehydrogenase
VKVSSNGGRYHYSDDWETPDTQVINLDFKEGVTMSWEGRSCNGKPVHGSSVGVIFYGEKGSLFIPGGNEYTVFDLKNNVIKEVKDNKEIDPRDAANPSGHLDALHIRNLFNNIRTGESLVADIDSGHKSTLLVQLGNIAQRTGQSLDINPENGHILGNKKAQTLWARKYEKGWEMKL